jgi:hypothetical protein
MACSVAEQLFLASERHQCRTVNQTAIAFGQPGSLPYFAEFRRSDAKRRQFLTEPGGLARQQCTRDVFQLCAKYGFTASAAP